VQSLFNQVHTHKHLQYMDERVAMQMQMQMHPIDLHGAVPLTFLEPASPGTVKVPDCNDTTPSNVNHQ
jgi:hypothetical protein